MNERSKPTLAVVGATGAVGGVLLQLLSERVDVWGEIRLIASERSAGKVLQVRGEDVVVQTLGADSFDGVDAAIFDVPTQVAREWIPRAVDRGTAVIDATSAYRSEPGVPLIVPEINPSQVKNRPRGIVASPNSTTLTLIDALWPLHSGWELVELVVATYQSASGMGHKGMARLYAEADALSHTAGVGTHTGGVRRRVATGLPPESPFPAPLAYNVVPWAGTLCDDGWSSEELKIRTEIRRVLGVPDLLVAATCVQVPVVIGHSVAVHATFRRPLGVEEARNALVHAPSVVVLDDPAHDEWPTPTDVVGSDPTFVGRMRQSVDFPNSIEFFVVGDNLRRGSALNVAQIGELLSKDLQQRETGKAAPRATDGF
ncbi:aspartate-semialdehyde dehydrogenase [Kineosphaera limosa]|uniref:Aspartate-semialdehyde dehydrogenase n=1 Tax=Kineosphaera limosa NBRC 100340 TaxID=1184609 RepID=K6WTZ3_9MICO|nr:aspartate-semialdehyde dehydrogenase [Kineosphaera limosa]NYE00188.1 aspartate-semialdehyde dehydrogenase [Kineosphaera limosa]GAB97286.1 aspartate-semialdehyde dehydrogenase [Kineosphaera limosa NBRC 100340]